MVEQTYKEYIKKEQQLKQEINTKHLYSAPVYGIVQS